MVCGLAILGLYWLLGDGGLGRQNRDYMATLTITLAVALLIERGSLQLFAIENDRLSILHVTLFALITLFWLLAARVGPAETIWAERVARLAALPSALRPLRPAKAAGGWHRRPHRARRRRLASVGLAMLILFPELARGPLGEVDPLYHEIRLQRIVEIQPLVSLEQLAAGRLGQIAGRVIQVIGIAFVAVPFLVGLLRRRSLPGHRVWAALALALALFLPLATYQVRWSSYAQILLVPPYSAFVAWLMLRVGEHLPLSRLQLVRPLIVVAALFWPIGLAQLMPQQKIVTATEVCRIARASAALNQLGRPGTILALADYGPELALPHTAWSSCRFPTTGPSPASMPATGRWQRPIQRWRGRNSPVMASTGSCSARASSRTVTSSRGERARRRLPQAARRYSTAPGCKRSGSTKSCAIPCGCSPSTPAPGPAPA